MTLFPEKSETEAWNQDGSPLVLGDLKGILLYAQLQTAMYSMYSL